MILESYDDGKRMVILFLKTHQQQNDTTIHFLKTIKIIHYTVYGSNKIVLFVKNYLTTITL